MASRTHSMAKARKTAFHSHAHYEEEEQSDEYGDDGVRTVGGGICSG